MPGADVLPVLAEAGLTCAADFPEVLLGVFGEAEPVRGALFPSRETELVLIGVRADAPAGDFAGLLAGAPDGGLVGVLVEVPAGGLRFCDEI